MEPLSDLDDAQAGLTEIGKTALPLVGRIGAIVGGIVSLLTVFEKVSGEVVAAVEGTLLLTAAVASFVVIWSRRTKIVDGQKITARTYPKRQRQIAALVGVLAFVLLIFFAARLITSYSAQQAISQTRPGGRAGATRLAENPARAATLAQLGLPGIPGATPLSPTGAATPRPTRNQTPSPLPVDQITDVNLLNKMGSEALDSRNYAMASSLFSRALQIQATNADAQYGSGLALYMLGNLSPALNHFQNALQLNPNLNDAHAYLGYIYDRRDDYVKARVEYQEFLRVSARDNPLRPDVQARVRQIEGSTPGPSLTPISPATSPLTPVPTSSHTPQP